MMKQVYLHFLIVFLFFIGCNNDKNREFKLPLPNEMAVIIADVHLAEATLSDNSATILSENHKGGFKLVLERYGLDKAGFDSSIAYYSAQPKVYQKIYEDVLAILTEREMAVRALKDDSVKVLNEKKDKNISTAIQNIWKGDKSIKVNSQDSTRIKAAFEFNVDSILGGEITLKAKYKFNAKATTGKKQQMRLFVTYINGSQDSSLVIVPNSISFTDVSTKILLKSLYLKKVTGNLITFSQPKPQTIDIIDIRLDWTPSPLFIDKIKE